MDPLPALHPIVLRHISFPPFEYSPEQGLTFKGHARASTAEVKKWVFPRKNARGKQVKEWWLAQLRLYGVEAKSSAKLAELTEALKRAYCNGQIKPSPAILVLEQQLERRFLQENLEAQEREYASSSDETKARTDPNRFLTENFCSQNKDKKLLALEVGDSQPLLDAAKQLGLRTAGAIGPWSSRWVIVGKDERDVAKRKGEIEKEFAQWEVEQTKEMNKRMREYQLHEEKDREREQKEREHEEKQRAAKRRKLESLRQKCELAGGEGTFKDVVGEWSIECPEMDKSYHEATRSMSIFFTSPPPTRRSERSYYSDEEGICSDDEYEEPGICRGDIPEAVAPLLLCANFKMGILEGTLRSNKPLPHPDSAKFPMAKPVSFAWRGIETGEGEIQFGEFGSFSFLSETKLKGILKSTYGNSPFTGCKVSRVPADKQADKWDDYREEAHEHARVARWH